MPTSQPRINLTVDVEMLMWIENVSKYKNQSLCETVKQSALATLERDYRAFKPTIEAVSAERSRRNNKKDIKTWVI